MNLAAILGKYSKFITAIVGAVVEAINLGLLPHNAQNYVTVAISILTALGVYGVTNGPGAGPTLTGLSDRVGNLETQLPKIPDLSNAVSTGVISALRTLGHTSDAPPPRTQLKAEAGPDTPDPTEATPAQILASVEPIPA